MFKKTFSRTTFIFSIIALIATFSACTENQRARQYGGTIKITVPVNQKVTNVTWKGGDIWYLTRPMTSDEQPTTWTFQEDSEFGLNEGKIILTESKK